ncbi:MAG: hypothetical protein EA369_00245 [Bradymonadales bacterium]|nr:MAG: hypothetical protein EA369_00245 [Bradymonadales bacterium]
MPRSANKKKTVGRQSRLRIGDQWSAITIIALSQSNPLKAVAEFVENSIDAGAKRVTIVRGKERGQYYLKIIDDGKGIPRDASGKPDFDYVATHICDSLKRRMKREGAKGLQGEFGIGLLSFWTVGEELLITSAGADGRAYQMQMAKGSPHYELQARSSLLSFEGTELKIKPLLSGLRQLSGQKMEAYLAAELRDRIRKSGVKIKIIDRQTRQELDVEPRQFSGELIRNISVAPTEFGEIEIELYLQSSDQPHPVSLYRAGTRVLTRLDELEDFQCFPWNSPYLQGAIDAPFLGLTPGTRQGLVYDNAYSAFVSALKEVEGGLAELVERYRQIEAEGASQETWKSLAKAFREALMALPPEDYDWFQVPTQKGRGGGGGAMSTSFQLKSQTAETENAGFQEVAGPLWRAKISPSAATVPVNGTRVLRALARDRQNRPVDHSLEYTWEVIEGVGELRGFRSNPTEFIAGSEPGLVRVKLTVRQKEHLCEAEALLTVTDELLPPRPTGREGRGLPSYTLERAAGELWRSRYDMERNLIIINSGHRDFIFASEKKALKIRYLCRLFAKEMVQKNFEGYPTDQLLERMVELSLYAEERLR